MKSGHYVIRNFVICMSHSVARVIKYRGLRWFGNVVRVGELRNT
jgi:hypothetical protein